jgi:hypothetical protein
MTKETAETTDLLRRFAEVIPSIPAKAVLLLCETTAATIHLRAALLPQPPQEPRPEQPSPYATVNAMGHKAYEGQVTVLPGRVLRVQAVELDRSNNIVVRIVDVHAKAVHSVEWATEEQHQRWRASLDCVAAERRAGWYRSPPLLADESSGPPAFIQDEGGEHLAQANEDAAEQAPDDMAVDDDDAPGEAGMEIGGKG